MKDGVVIGEWWGVEGEGTAGEGEVVISQHLIITALLYDCMMID